MLRRKKRALVVGACVLAFYLLHFGWFHFFGPPDWFHGVRERAPEISSVALGSAFDRYLEEFDRPPEARLGPAGSPGREGTVGRVVREDRLEDGTALCQTREEDRDHLYLLGPPDAEWREQVLPPFERLEDSRLLLTEDGRRVVMVGRRSWWPFAGNYGRFFTALLRPELRPESGLYVSNPRSGESGFLFPGYLPVPSPDRRSVAFLRSERRGFHSIHLWRPGDERPRTVASLWEAEPGSGLSFHFTWSSDSGALFIRGLARGSIGAPAAQRREVRLLYDAEGDRLVELRP